MDMGRDIKLIKIVKVFIICLCMAFAFVGAGKGFEVGQNNVVGKWRSRSFSKKLAIKIGLNEPVESTIEIRNDGSFTARNFPVRSPYRLVDLEGRWRVISGEMTPSGKDSLLLDDNFLTGARTVGNDCLVYLVSGKDEIKVVFYRQ